MIDARGYEASGEFSPTFSVKTPPLPVGDTTLPERFFFNATNTPDKSALTFEETSFTYGETQAIIASFAESLRAQGVGRGDRLATCLPNRPEHFFALHAAWRLGAIHVPINVAFTIDEAVFILNDCGARFVIAEPERAEALHGVRHRVPSLTSIASTDDSPHPDVISFAAATAEVIPSPAAPEVDPGSIAVLGYTSGTTGQPKGSILTHYHLATFVSASREFMQLDWGDNVVQALPCSGTNGTVNGILLAWYLGGHGVLMRRFQAQSFVDLVRTHQIAFSGTVPTLLADLIRTTDATAHDFGSIKSVCYGAAPPQPHVIGEIETRLGIRMIQAYGMTEAPYIGLDLPGLAPRRDTAVRPVPFVTVEIFDDNMNPAPAGTTGEICLTPPPEPDFGGRQFLPIPGYWNNETLTNEAQVGGVFHTGDLGFLDADGYLRVVDRKKDLIVRGGTNISAVEIEQAILAHKDVDQAYAVGAPDERLGEVPVGYVVLVDGAATEPSALLAHANDLLAPIKRLAAIHLIADSDLPRNAGGKVLKRELKRQSLT